MVIASLLHAGGGIVAEGRLLDLIRRLYCFGISLLKMDVRQESSRHTEAIDSITRLVVCTHAWEYSMLRPEVMLQADQRNKQVAAPVVVPDFDSEIYCMLCD